MQNESWNILEHMMQKRGYSVATSTAQMQVVGRRHYGLKAIPFGGGGGRQITRELSIPSSFGRGACHSTRKARRPWRCP